MKVIYSTIMMILIWGTLVLADGTGQNTKAIEVSFRVIPHGESLFLCRGINKTSEAVNLSQVVKPFENYNSLNYYVLDKKYPPIYGTGALRSYGPDEFPPPLQLNPMDVYSLVIKEVFGSNDHLKGSYMKMGWFFGRFDSQKIYVGFPNKDGMIETPVVDLPIGLKTYKDHLALAFIFDDQRHHELGFLVMNKREYPFVAIEPLSEKSSILVTAPSIDYRREIFVKSKEIVEHEIPSGEVAEWRIAWSKVLKLIPEEDQKKIIEAGGDLDLVWRTGGEDSPPLLMNIAPPEMFKDSVLIPHPEKENTMIIADPSGNNGLDGSMDLNEHKGLDGDGLPRSPVKRDPHEKLQPGRVVPHPHKKNTLIIIPPQKK